MKLLYVITQGEQGGAQRHVRDVALSMMEKGHEIFVAIGKQVSESDVWLKNELISGSIPAGNICTVSSLRRSISAHDFFALFALISLDQQIKPDVVHLHSSKAGILGSIAGFIARTPTVYTVHGFVFNEPQSSIKQGFYICVEWLAARLRSKTIVLSRAEEKIGLSKGILWPDSYAVIPNGIEALQAVLSREQSRKELNAKLPAGFFARPVVGTIANLYPAKGLQFLIQAIGILKRKGIQVSCLIVGDGDERAFLETEIQAEDVRQLVQMIGRIVDAERYMKAFDVFALSSVKEGMPYVALEAVSAGIPIVATDVGALSEMAQKIQHMTIVAPLDSVALSDAISKMIQAHILGFSGSLPVEYTLASMTEHTEQVYSDVR